MKIEEKFARRLLQDNSELQSFTVMMPDADFARKVADALEQLGCEVTRLPNGVTLEVTRPQANASNGFSGEL